MPLTFPSHAAAILPLLHLRPTRWLPASALVVGSTAPDLIYLIGTHGAEAHRPAGLLKFCLPFGVLAFLYLEGVLLPTLGGPLRSLLPDRLGKIGARILGPRPLPRSLGGWLAIGLALLVGAVSHQLWDGFTHAWMWPARSLYPGATISIFGHAVFVVKLMQHGSSVLGLAIVLLYLWRSAPQEPALEGTKPQRGAAIRRLLLLLTLPLLGGAIAGALSLRSPDPLVSRALWNAAWSAAAWFALLLGAVCLFARSFTAGAAAAARPARACDTATAASHPHPDDR